jgi:GNAT superfamily N-acetyltransferase
MEIRPWRPGDELLALAAERYFSAASLSQRFLTGTAGRLPVPYLRHIAAGPRDAWDAQVAATPTHLIGWAEFGRLSGNPRDADLAVLVADPWQRRGVATALIRALLSRCVEAGVRRLHADVAPGNHGVRALLGSLSLPGLTAAFVDGTVHYELPLPVALRDTPPAGPCPLSRRGSVRKGQFHQTLTSTGVEF